MAAGFAAWAAELAGRAASMSSRTPVPEWVGTAAELLRDWSQQLDQRGRTPGHTGTAATLEM
ncbi:MAG TPA: hypothetical protein VFA49_09435, partial [Chloroflexota bacterium]|nr:hypothetical protein [Chloroflexota bacterium]